MPSKIAHFSLIAVIFSTANQPKTIPNLKFCFIKMAHRATYMYIYNDYSCSVFCQVYTVQCTCDYLFSCILCLETSRRLAFFEGVVFESVKGQLISEEFFFVFRYAKKPTIFFLQISALVSKSG